MKYYYALCPIASISPILHYNTSLYIYMYMLLLCEGYVHVIIIYMTLYFTSVKFYQILAIITCYTATIAVNI